MCLFTRAKDEPANKQDCHYIGRNKTFSVYVCERESLRGCGGLTVKWSMDVSEIIQTTEGFMLMVHWSLCKFTPKYLYIRNTRSGRSATNYDTSITISEDDLGSSVYHHPARETCIYIYTYIALLSCHGWLIMELRTQLQMGGCLRRAL